MKPDEFAPAAVPANYRSPAIECQFAHAWARLAAERGSATGSRRVTVLKPVALAGGKRGTVPIQGDTSYQATIFPDLKIRVLVSSRRGRDVTPSNSDRPLPRTTGTVTS
jgi:hypothetical protein